MTVSVCSLCLRVRCSPDETASPPPPPPNVISLPLGPPTNPPNREKIERFIGTPVRTPPGFMTNRQCLSLSRERQSTNGWKGEAEREKKNRVKEQSDPNLRFPIEPLKGTESSLPE